MVATWRVLFQGLIFLLPREYRFSAIKQPLIYCLSTMGMQVLQLWQQCCWWFRFIGMWCCHWVTSAHCFKGPLVILGTDSSSDPRRLEVSLNAYTLDLIWSPSKRWRYSWPCPSLDCRWRWVVVTCCLCIQSSWYSLTGRLDGYQSKYKCFW